MPYNSLMMLAILAFGLLWLLGIFSTSNVEILWVFVMHTFLVGFYFSFVMLQWVKRSWHDPYPWLSGQALCSKWGLCTFHHCTWRCHYNFDHDNCTLLCEYNYVHLNCNTCLCPDLYSPPASFPSTSALASFPFQHQPASTFIDSYTNDLLFCHCHPQTMPTDGGWVNGAHLLFIILCLTLEGYVTELKRNREHCCTTPNRHECQTVHDNDWPYPIPFQPLSRCGFSAGSPCYQKWSAKWQLALLDRRGIVLGRPQTVGTRALLVVNHKQ